VSFSTPAHYPSLTNVATEKQTFDVGDYICSVRKWPYKSRGATTELCVTIWLQRGCCMHEPVHRITDSRYAAQVGSVAVMSRAEMVHCQHWQSAFVGQRKDHRFYELVEDTIRQGFDYRYFAIKDRNGEIQAIQPFFILDQDLLAGIHSRIREAVCFARRLWPRLLKTRTLMVGCAVGEGRLDGHGCSHGTNAQLLASAIVAHARWLKAPLIVLKEFPAGYRAPLNCFLHHGFYRVPSLPMTRLNIDYPSFDAYMATALTHQSVI
jgi:hypothetical protein